jgi:hypothetical protein
MQKAAKRRCKVELLRDVGMTTSLLLSPHLAHTMYEFFYGCCMKKRVNVVFTES